MQGLAKIIREQLWDSKPKWHELSTNNDDIRKYINVCDELTINYEADIVLRGSRIVIPRSLQHRVISIAHEGCQNKTIDT